MEIRITPTAENATPLVMDALSQLKRAGGGQLHFEKGEYHFYKAGTLKRFFAITNNSACDKYVVFPIIDMENITIDGHGSVFVFHELVFPFMVSNSKQIVLRNFLVDTGKSPLVNFQLYGFSDEGFYMDIDREESPFSIENGSINFHRESGIWRGKEQLMSLHAIGRHYVQYLATGEKDADHTILPAPMMKCDLTETPTGVYARYRADSPSRCIYEEETVSSIIDGRREVDVICLDRSREIKISNITVARGIGMGVIGQLSTDISIDGFSTDAAYHGGQQTLTADSLHFVNCDGKLEIQNCAISDTMDDAINVHGMYTVLSGICEQSIQAKIMHPEQLFFNPYRPGDRLEFIDNTTFEIVAEMIVASAELQGETGDTLLLTGPFTYGKDRLQAGFWLENPDRMPDLHLHHNHFRNFPHNRISGAGNMIVEDNHFTDCHAALYCFDLARYWYESGRVKHLVYRNNTLINCDKTGNGAFLFIGIDGIREEDAPKIHKHIEITGNHFSQIQNLAIRAGGVQELILEGNTFDRDIADCVQVF